MVDWCAQNNLELDVSKTKKKVVDFRKNKTTLHSTSSSSKQSGLRDGGVNQFLGLHHLEHS